MQFNVTVNCIAPGLTNTAATEKQVPTDFQPMFATMSAMRRNTEPEHMVGPAVFFASSDADLVNGQVLVVDGGNVMPVMSAIADADAEIRNVLARIAQLADTRRSRRVPHAVHRRRGLGHARQPVCRHGGQRAPGHAEIRAGAEERRASGLQGPGTNSRHVLTTIAVDLESDDRATVRSYFLFFGPPRRSRCCAPWVSTTTCSCGAQRGWQLAHRTITPG